MSFDQAKALMQSQGIKTNREFIKWNKAGNRPKDFPSNPNIIYKDKWRGWGDFLGTGNISTRKREKRKWMSFNQAKALMQSQGIKTSTEFNEWKKAGKRPKDFPSNPAQTYRNKWRGWGDFLGTGNISTRNREKRDWMSFQDAKTLMQSQDIRTREQFREWRKSEQRPEHFPSHPDEVYTNEWRGWRDFLGTKWMSFEDAKAFIQSQGIKTSKEFEKWRQAGKRPEDFPSNPRRTYKNEWKSWKDFLGTKKQWMSFDEAKTFIQNFEIKSKGQFYKWLKSGQKPEHFPSVPEKFYKNEWISWGDFLGTGNISITKGEWMSFEDAKAFIQSQGIKTSTEFNEWKKSGNKPKSFPSNPDRVYKKKWVSWGDFLGTGSISTRKRKWRSFDQAKDLMQSQGIKTYKEFREWKKAGKRPKDFPSNPPKTYKNEWRSWEDFLGTKKHWMSFDQAKDLMQSQGIKTYEEFREWKQAGKRPKDFPSTPDKAYKDKWRGWGNFLGTENHWMSFEDAKTFIQNFEIKSKGQFNKWLKSGQKPEDFPSSPPSAYKNEWRGWGDFLGTGNTISYMKYSTAKKHVQSLEFEQPKDFIEWLQSDDRPIHFPPNPQNFYSEWINLKDFLSEKEYMTYEEAKTFIQQLGIKNQRDFFEEMKNNSDIFPENFPPNPKTFYTNTGEWTGWHDFLGLTIKSDNKINRYRKDFQIEENDLGQEDIFTDEEEGSGWGEDVEF